MTGGVNVLVIVLDAMREDSVVPSFEEPGRCFKAATCIASAPWTLPSCTSLITGMDATRHGHFWHTHALGASDLINGIPTEFRKVAFVNNSVLKRNSQLDVGFDHWRYLAGHTEPFDRGATLIRKARRRKPLFLLLHSNISHDYYYPKASEYYDEAFPDAPGGAFVLGDDVIRWSGTTPAQRAAVVKTYEASAIKAVASAREVLELARARDDFISVVVSDHGEGLEYDEARIHHGGRLHDDLLRVPLYFDLPSMVPASQSTDLASALASVPVAVTDVLPTAFALAGMDPVPTVDGRRMESGSSERTVVSEERRYLYLRDRFRLNVKGRHRFMSPEDQEENRRLLDQLAAEPLLRSYRSKSAKLMVTGLHFRPRTGSPAEARREMMRWGERLLGAPLLALHGDRLFAFELYDLTDDPSERHNLLAVDGDGMDRLMESGRDMSVTVPVGDASEEPEVHLSTMLAGAERIASL